MKSIQLKKTLATLTLLGFGAVLLFWSSGMHDGTDHSCISASIQNAVCPDSATPGAALFHFKTLQSITNAVAQGAQFFTFLVLAFALLVVLDGLRPSAALQSVRVRPFRESSSPPPEYRRWLALLEHSPSPV